MATKISAKILADSISPQGMRITSYLVTFPRFILPELATHRMFSKNSASSRAIPFEKMVKMVEEDPFIPIAWQKDHKGMQGNEYLTHVEANKEDWLKARDYAVEYAENLNNGGEGVTKQLCNRLLEPFMWHTVLLTATEFENFFELRCPKYINAAGGVFKSKKDFLKSWYAKNIGRKPSTDLDWLKINKSQAEIHIQALAELMWDARNESTPTNLKVGEWHIPKFHDNILLIDHNIIPKNLTIDEFLLKISTARCARLSYMTFGKEIDYEKDIELHDRLLKDRHMSPMEHCARVMSDEEFDLYIKGKLSFRDEDSYDLEEPLYKQKGWCDNLRGFISYRHLVENNLPII